MMNTAMGSGNWLWMLVMAIIFIIPIWRICVRVGYPGALSLLMVIPLINLGLLYFLAFSDWPVNSSRPDSGDSGQ